MKKLLLGTAAAFTLGCLVAMPASAALITVTSTSGIPVNLTLDTNDALDALGGYDILNASGNINGEAITGVIPPSGSEATDGAVDYNNVYFGTGSPFDYNGWYFAAGADELNIYLDTTLLSNVYDPNGSLGDRGEAFTYDVSVPEPATYAVFGMALIAFAGLTFLRRREGGTPLAA